MRKNKAPLIANSGATAQRIYKKGCQLTKPIAFYGLSIICNDSTAAKKQKFYDQVENSSSNDNNEKLAIKKKVNMLEKRIEMVECIV
uniref:Uncharacterized protein n=1 Tax=Romanomermis culicivorax TaxID=13658 RepID=A0A915L0C8_ROMCU